MSKFDINELMNIHQLNNYIKQHNLTDRQLSKKENKIVKIIKYSSRHYYFYYLPTDIKNIIIDLLFPSSYFIGFINTNNNYDCNTSYNISSYYTKIIIKFKKLDKYCILFQKHNNNHRKIIFNTNCFDIYIYKNIDIYIDYSYLYIQTTDNYSFNFFSINTNNIDLEFKVLYQN